MEFVPMTHPGIEPVAYVPASSVPQHKKAGWKPVTEKTADSREKKQEKEEKQAPK